MCWDTGEARPITTPDFFRISTPEHNPTPNDSDDFRFHGSRMHIVDSTQTCVASIGGPEPAAESPLTVSAASLSDQDIAAGAPRSLPLAPLFALDLAAVSSCSISLGPSLAQHLAAESPRSLPLGPCFAEDSGTRPSRNFTPGSLPSQGFTNDLFCNLSAGPSYDTFKIPPWTHLSLSYRSYLHPRPHLHPHWGH